MYSPFKHLTCKDNTRSIQLEAASILMVKSFNTV